MSDVMRKMLQMQNGVLVCTVFQLPSWGFGVCLFFTAAALSFLQLKQNLSMEMPWDDWKYSSHLLPLSGKRGNPLEWIELILLIMGATFLRKILQDQYSTSNVC